LLITGRAFPTKIALAAELTGGSSFV